MNSMSGSTVNTADHLQLYSTQISLSISEYGSGHWFLEREDPVEFGLSIYYDEVGYF